VLVRVWPAIFTDFLRRRAKNLQTIRQEQCRSGLFCHWQLLSTTRVRLAEEALILIRALQGGDKVPDEVADALRENGRVAHQTVLQKQLTAAAQGQRLGRCAALAKELEDSSHDEEDRAGWRKLRQQFEHRRSVQRWKWGAAAAIGGIIIVASLSDHSYTPSSTNRSPTTQSPSYPHPSDVFTASEIQWCVF
jgi:hypothetical protein